VKILLDECIPRKLKLSFPTHDCSTVPQIGLSGKKNGELLLLATERGFQVFITVDQGIVYQQSPAGEGIAILILHAQSNRLADLLPFMPECLKRIESATQGTIVHIGG